MDISTSIGVTGATIVLIAFVLNQIGKIKVESRMYDVCNIIGPLALMVYAILLDSYPFIVLNAAWVIVSAYALYQSFKGSEIDITQK